MKESVTLGNFLSMEATRQFCFWTAFTDGIMASVARGHIRFLSFVEFEMNGAICPSVHVFPRGGNSICINAKSAEFISFPKLFTCYHVSFGIQLLMMITV